MDRIKKLKIKKQDGTFSDYIPIGADAENIDTTDGESVQLKLNKNKVITSFLTNGHNDEITLVNNEFDINTSDYLLINSNLSLSKEAMLKLQSKDVKGNGTITYDNYRDSENNLLNGTAKVEYLKRPVYMSMKNPSDTISSYFPSRVNGIFTSTFYRPEGYNNAVTIAAIYANDYSILPDNFDVYIGKVRTYLLFDDDNFWTLHDEFDTFPSGFHTYQLPWSSHQSSIFTNTTIKKDYVILHLTKEDLHDKVIHFWTTNNWEIDCSKMRGAVSMYEAWTDTEDINNNLFCTIGIDQRNKNSPSSDIKQLFSGRNFGLTTSKQIVVGHAIPEVEYLNMIEDDSLDPDMLYFDFINKNTNYIKYDSDETLIDKCPFVVNLGFVNTDNKWVEIASYNLSEIESSYFLNLNLELLLCASNEDCSLYDVVVEVKHSAGSNPTVLISSNSVQNSLQGYIDANILHLYYYSQAYQYPIILFKSITGYIDRLSFSDLIQQRYSVPVFASHAVESEYIKDSVTGVQIGTRNMAIKQSITSFLSSSIVNSTTINYSYTGYNWYSTSDISGIEDSGRYIVEYIVSTASENSIYALQRLTLVSSATPKTYIRVLNNGVWSNLIKTL